MFITMNRSRAVLLPHPADPCMFTYWLHLFEIWESEVDKLYIYVNSPIEKPVIRYMHSLVADNPKINWQYNDVQTEHGFAIDRMLDIVQEDNIMLVEDDGYIFKPGVVDKYFSALESDNYDIVGSARGSCSMEIWEASRLKYDLNYSGLGDVGPNFWPCFFFSLKNVLLQTDRNFGAKHWPKGTQIKELGYTVMEDGCYGDTFVNTSIQLRKLVPKDRILMIPQYHGSPDDLEHYEKQYNLFDGVCPWVHVGSLSSGTHGVLQDDFGRPLARRLIDPPKESPALAGVCNTEQERREWERRVQWWQTFLDYFLEANMGSLNASMLEFAGLYKNAIKRIIHQYSLRTENIAKRQHIYKTLGL